MCIVGKVLTSKQKKTYSISGARAKLQSVAHVADFDNALNEYLKIYRPYFERSCAKYNEIFLHLNVRRIRGPADNKWFHGYASSSHFISELRHISAPKSNKKVCQGLIDFIDFLTENGSSGPNKYLDATNDKKILGTSRKLSARHPTSGNRLRHSCTLGNSLLRRPSMRSKK